MFKVSFFPLGNADTTRIDLPSSGRILFDFAAKAPGREGIEFDLEEAIRADLRKAGRTAVDVLCITHVDEDHCLRFDEVFHLDHSKAHQGGGRIGIETLWVPAAAITETGLGTEAAKRVQKEAQHRLRQGWGIVVFSAPKALDDWLASEGLDAAGRQNCIVHAGKPVPGYDLRRDGIEFFAHSPLSWRQDEQGVEVVRNSASIVVQAVMRVGGADTRFLLGADVDSEDLVEIVSSTRRHENDERLDWDVLKLFHHCSYKALDKDDRGEETETVPVDEVADLIEAHGQDGSIIVSPSLTIPRALSKDGDQPPHRQAANYYQRIQNGRGGQFKVTMDTPRRPVVVEVSERGVAVEPAIAAARGRSDLAARTGGLTMEGRAEVRDDCGFHDVGSANLTREEVASGALLSLLRRLDAAAPEAEIVSLHRFEAGVEGAVVEVDTGAPQRPVHAVQPRERLLLAFLPDGSPVVCPLRCDFPLRRISIRCRTTHPCPPGLPSASTTDPGRTPGGLQRCRAAPTRRLLVQAGKFGPHGRRSPASGARVLPTARVDRAADGRVRPLRSDGRGVA